MFFLSIKKIKLLVMEWTKDNNSIVLVFIVLCWPAYEYFYLAF